MECIGTPRFSVVLNGILKGNIIPSRGLRHRCPLSPYLFLLCAEGFSSLPNEAERWGNLMGFACRCTSSLVSYLLFIDDSLVFCHANLTECDSKYSLAIHARVLPGYQYVKVHYFL